MSSIKFDATLDTSKLEAGIKQANKTVKEWARDVEKAGDQAETGLNKVTKSFGQSIKDQKILIKSIEEDVKRLQKVYDDAAAGSLKSAAGGEVSAAKRSLLEEKAKLNELQKDQIEGTKELDKSTSGLVGKVGKLAAAYFTVDVIIKVLKQTVLAFFTKTQEGFDLLERKVNGFKASVGVLQGEFIKLSKAIVGERADEPIQWGTKIVNVIKAITTTAQYIPKVAEWFNGLEASMNDAGVAAENYTRITQELANASVR